MLPASFQCNCENFTLFNHAKQIKVQFKSFNILHVKWSLRCVREPLDSIVRQPLFFSGNSQLCWSILAYYLCILYLFVIHTKSSCCYNKLMLFCKENVFVITYLQNEKLQRLLFLVVAFCHISSTLHSKIPKVQTVHSVHPLWLTWWLSLHRGSDIVQVSLWGRRHVSLPFFVTFYCSLSEANTSAVNTILSDEEKMKAKRRCLFAQSVAGARYAVRIYPSSYLSDCSSKAIMYPFC